MAERPAAARRILLITNNLPPVRGGSGIVYDNLARHAGGRIVVMAPKRSYENGLPLIGWREHDRLAPYRVLRLDLLRTVLREDAPGWSWRLRDRLHDAAIRVRLFWELARCLARDGITAVCVGELVASAWILSLLRLFPSVTRVVYVHGEEITTRDGYDPDQNRRRRALLAAHRVIVVSRFTANAVSELLGEKETGRLRLIENGVDASRFRHLPRRPDLVEMYGLEGRFVFVSVCRLLEKKGVDQTIRAFARVLEQFPGCRFLVVGDGPYRAALQTLAAGLGVGRQVVFAGSVAEDDLVDHYALGDVFVMPNRRLPNGDTEGFGLVFLEANACGLPVIAGSDGGSTDAVRHGVNGLVVDGHSVDAVAEAMLRLHGDSDLREQLRRGGREAAAVADWRHKTQAFMEMMGNNAPVF